MSITTLSNLLFYSCAFLFLILLAFEFATQVRTSANIFAIQKNLREYGQVAIVDSFELIKEPSGRGHKYFIAYQFGEAYTNKQEISNSHYMSLKNWDNPIIEVRYLASNPEISRLDGDDKDNIDRDFATIIAVLFSVLLPPTLPIVFILWIVTYHRMSYQLNSH